MRFTRRRIFLALFILALISLVILLVENLSTPLNRAALNGWSILMSVVYIAAKVVNSPVTMLLVSAALLVLYGAVRLSSRNGIAKSGDKPQ